MSNLEGTGRRIDMVELSIDCISDDGGDDDDGTHMSNHEESADDHPRDDDSNVLVKNIVQRETRFVRCLRLGLLVILLTASASASAVVYQSLSKQEVKEFTAAFHDYSTKLSNEFQIVAERRLGAIAAFGTSITSSAITSKNNSSSSIASWPFVTIPQYEAQARYVAKIALLETLGFAPIVTFAQREEWEQEFVPQHINEWISESMAAKLIYDPNTNTSLLSHKVVKAVRNQTHVTVPGYREKIFETRVTPEGNLTYDVATGNGPYMPLWQVAPYVPDDDYLYLNFDMNSDVTFDRNVIRILSQQKAALGRITSQGYGRHSTNPTSGFYYPVLTDLPQNSTLAGSLVTLIFWLPFFSNILPESAVGMIGVLENTCSQTFTFRIDGANVTFVGNDDQHDPSYDYFRKEVSFSALLTESYESQQYLGFPIDDTGCQYFLSIYPSNDLEKQYLTHTPMIAAILILLIFLATSSVFILYDRLVERRQRLVQKEAESSGAIVSSLFPAAYRDRLMAAHTGTVQQKSSRNTSNTKDSKGLLLRNFLSGDHDGDNADTGYGDAIADLFQDCTVFFADIAGFTHWSSTREPLQVFCLLQELYGAIDKIAKKFCVFKVETIGDCYMAVTGLPNPQMNHAQLMARFATECVIHMRTTTLSLVDKLGDDTAELKLRIGLHSGPVTAGILLGEKSRFQLFGDTVNTASRMESTGEPDRIQMSETTANILRQNGKGHWLLPRQDFVEVKGKGTMQTYWLAHGRRSGCSAVSRSLPSTKDEIIEGENATVYEYGNPEGSCSDREAKRPKQSVMGDLFEV